MVDSDKKSKKETEITTDEEIVSDSHIENTQEDMDVSDIETEVTKKVKQLKNELRSAEEERRKTAEELQRAKAEFLNAKKRLNEEVAVRIAREREDVISSLLPVCDSFGMAMQNTTQWELVDPMWRKGVEAIYAQLQSVLEQHNVTQIKPTGEVFDPNLHEAIEEKSTNDPKLHNTVSNVVQPGYQIKRADATAVLLRPARVEVYVASESDSDATPTS